MATSKQCLKCGGTMTPHYKPKREDDCLWFYHERRGYPTDECLVWTCKTCDYQYATPCEDTTNSLTSKENEQSGEAANFVRVCNPRFCDKCGQELPTLTVGNTNTTSSEHDSITNSESIPTDVVAAWYEARGWFRANGMEELGGRDMFALGDALATELERLKAEYMARLSIDQGVLADFEDMTQSYARAVKALRRYGRHEPGCLPQLGCDCGLVDVL